MRVLFVGRSADLATLGGLVSQLEKAGLDVVIHVQPVPGEDLLTTVLRELSDANRVVVVWTSEVQPDGTIHEVAADAARGGKLLLLVLNSARDPLGDDVHRVRWQLTDDPPVDDIVRELRSHIEPVPIPRPSSVRELFQTPSSKESTLANDGLSPPDLSDDGESTDKESNDTPEQHWEVRQEAARRATSDDDVLYSMGSDNRLSRRLITPDFRSGSGRKGILYAGDKMLVPAEAAAFAPRKLRRQTPELVQIAIFHPSDFRRVKASARSTDPRTLRVNKSIGLGRIAAGTEIRVSLQASGAHCELSTQAETWHGQPLTLYFSVEAEADARQVILLVRLFAGDAQIGVIPIVRRTDRPTARSTPADKPALLVRHKRVFLSYCSRDREVVASIATAYQVAGIDHFFDRTSLTSGEQWSNRIQQEIDRCDLFHLCWSKAASESEWVNKEATHALTRNRRKKRPVITVQMLDGPPWAPHPPHLDSINFDDFVRAAVVGYARGEQASASS